MPSLVSIVIPTYNRRHCVGDAIDSVLAQTHRPIEVLVVDDGSSDGTAEHLAARYGDHPEVRVLRQANAGVSAARNHGLREARGEFVALLDSDDAWEPWTLELQVACLRARPEAGMVWTDMSAVDEEGHVRAPRYIRKMYRAYGTVDLRRLFAEAVPLASIAPSLAPAVGDATLHVGRIFSRMCLGNLVHTSTVLLRRAWLERLRGFDETLRISGEDFDFHLRTCREGPVAFADVPSTRYRIGHGDALSRKEYHVHMAENLIRTLEPVLRDARREIDLPEAELRGKLAQAHEWLGAERLERGEAGAARTALGRSLRLHPSRRALMLWMATFLPGTLRERVRMARRRILLPH